MTIWDEWAKQHGVAKPDYVPDNLDELADRIQQHLRAGKFEAADCVPTSRTVKIKYGWPDNRWYSLNRERAQNYLRWLRAGNCDYWWRSTGV